MNENKITKIENITENIKIEKIKNFFEKIKNLKNLYFKINALKNTQPEITTSEIDRSILKNFIIEVLKSNTEQSELESELEEDLKRLWKNNNYSILLLDQSIKNKVKEKINIFVDENNQIFSEKNKNDLYFIFFNFLEPNFIKEIEKHRKNWYQVSKKITSNNTSKEYVTFKNGDKKRNIIVSLENWNYKIINNINFYKSWFLNWLLSILDNKK